MHRIVWSVPMPGAVLLALGRTVDVRAALAFAAHACHGCADRRPSSRSTGASMSGRSRAGRTVETALGYYINPLVSISMGAVLLGERLSRLQVVCRRARRRSPCWC